MKLKQFQERIIEELNEKLAEKNKVVVKAPTGSGKTFTMANFIKDWLANNTNGIVFWLVGSAGNLISQTKETFARITQTTLNEVDDFIRSEPISSINFISWDKINNKDNKATKETENHSFLSRVNQIKDLDYPVLVVIDEAHRNTSKGKSKDIFEATLKTIANMKEIDITATPNEPADIVVRDNEVISTGRQTGSALTP